MITIGIVDDHPIVRSGLRTFLSEQDGLRVVGEGASGRDAINLVRTIRPDVLVMDLAMPGHGGLDAIGSIAATDPQVGVLVFSGFPADLYALHLIGRGARGYLNKECDPAEIVDAIRVIGRGGRYITSGVALLLSQPLERRQALQPHELLSDREFQVFLKLANGACTSEISAQLSLSHKTVTTYRSRVMAKLKLHSNCDLTYYAVKNRLIG